MRKFNQSTESEVLPHRSTRPEAVGLILLDAHMKVVYVSSTAHHILSYQHSGKSGAPPEDQLSFPYNQRWLMAVWSGLFNFLGVLVSSGAVAFGNVGPSMKEGADGAFARRAGADE